jgi:hypothetical protein
MSSSNPQLVLLFSLADNALSLRENARTKLLDWYGYGDVCSQARNQCAQHEPTGALTLVARDETWNAYPGHLTNAAQVTAGTHPPAYERPAPRGPCQTLPQQPPPTVSSPSKLTRMPWPGTTRKLMQQLPVPTGTLMGPKTFRGPKIPVISNLDSNTFRPLPGF